MTQKAAALVGVGLALVLVGVIGTLAYAHMPPFGTPSAAPPVEGVVVALVLPDASGASAASVVDIYAPQGPAWSVRSVAPTSPAVVSGTSGSTLADAYSFGGGPGLLAAVDTIGEPAPRHWLVVTESAWASLHGLAPIVLSFPTDMEVFDGSRLYSFAEGTESVPVNELPEVAKGMSYLSANDARLLREQLGSMLQSTLASATTLGGRGLQSDLSPASLDAWHVRLPRAQRVAGS